MVVLVS